MKITILGAGYVGLVSGTCYSTTGNHVTMVDVNEDRVVSLRQGVIPIFEPGLESLVEENVKAGRLAFTTDMADACKNADVIGIAVGTPQNEQGECDLQYVMAAARAIAKSIDSYTVVVTKSTVPVGTGKKIVELIRSLTDVEFDYVSNPEFLKEGTAINDFMYPERVIIGTVSDRARKTMTHLYEPFMRRSDRLLAMDVESAELSKYACNSMLALRISFMNDLSQLADKIGADINEVRRAMGTDSRIGNSFLFPGLGYGGSCFPKDVQALTHTAKEHGMRLELVEGTHTVNIRQSEYFFNKIHRYFDGNLKNRQFAVWGLAFKPQTDDVREAPAIRLIEKLLDADAKVCAYDPEARTTTQKILGNSISYVDRPYDALDQSDGLVVCTEWLEFRTPDFTEIARRLNTPVIFDGRNLYSHEILQAAEIDYHCIGRSA